MFTGVLRWSCWGGAYKHLYCISRETEPRVSQIWGTQHGLGKKQEGRAFWLKVGMKGQRIKQADLAQCLHFLIDCNTLNHLRFPWAWNTQGGTVLLDGRPGRGHIMQLTASVGVHGVIWALSLISRQNVSKASKRCMLSCRAEVKQSAA